MSIFRPVAASVTLTTALMLGAPYAAAVDVDSETLDAIVVMAQHLNDARNGIQTQTGASTYVIDEAAIAAAPGGDNSLLNQVVMQAPDVVQDSFGPLHVRGARNKME